MSEAAVAVAAALRRALPGWTRHDDLVEGAEWSLTLRAPGLPDGLRLEATVCGDAFERATFRLGTSAAVTAEVRPDGTLLIGADVIGRVPARVPPGPTQLQLAHAGADRHIVGQVATGR